jgi:hypothetical protein
MMPNKNHNTARYYEEHVRQKLQVLDWHQLFILQQLVVKVFTPMNLFLMSFNLLMLLISILFLGK